jgi:hypothetical protein
MAIIMNMSNYEIEREATAPMGEEASRSGWNPQLHLVTLDHLSTVMKQHLELPVSLVTADAEAFLQEMHAYRC